MCLHVFFGLINRRKIRERVVVIGSDHGKEKRSGFVKGRAVLRIAINSVSSCYGRLVG